ARHGDRRTVSARGAARGRPARPTVRRPRSGLALARSDRRNFSPSQPQTTSVVLYGANLAPSSVREALSPRSADMASTRGLQFEAGGEPAEVVPWYLGVVRGRSGLRPVLPSGAGQSGVGRISATGPGTMAHSVGDRVLIIPTGQQFTWRERVNVDVANIVT